MCVKGGVRRIGEQSSLIFFALPIFSFQLFISSEIMNLHYLQVRDSIYIFYLAFDSIDRKFIFGKLLDSRAYELNMLAYPRVLLFAIYQQMFLSYLVQNKRM